MTPKYGLNIIRLFFCPKEWRLRMISSCTDELTGMVHTATWGSADLKRAGRVMTRAGTGGRVDLTM